MERASLLPSAYRHLRGCRAEYGRTAGWLRFFGGVAERIISDINPDTVLDAGCGSGLLVESLRRRGVEAYGIALSDDVVRNMHPVTRPFCRTGLITEPLGKQYDLIVSLEAAGCLPPHEAEPAVANMCEHSDDVLFSACPVPAKDLIDFNTQPLEYWATLFARQGFFRDVDFDAGFVCPWAVRFRQMPETVPRIVADYERQLWRLQTEVEAVRASSLEHPQELVEKDQLIRRLESRVRHLERQREQLEDTLGYSVMSSLRALRAAVAPPNSVRDQIIEGILGSLRTRDPMEVVRALWLAIDDVSRRLRQLAWAIRLRLAPPRGEAIEVPEVSVRPPAQPHQKSVDIVVCVHNALSDVQNCLRSIYRHTTQPYTLILVDDGSDAATYDYVAEYAQKYGATLIRNEQARGYTRAANQGMRRSTAEYLVLLNSDTIVTEDWLDGMVACAESDPRIGLVGPLSNTASWQSIPEVEVEGDWATNPLPADVTIDQMAGLVARYSGRLYPRMPLLNGFCLLIGRDVIKEIGYLDEEAFEAYGEEDDYVMRARRAGWQGALADDVYVYHAQSRSYSDSRRHALVRTSCKRLEGRYGRAEIAEAVAFCRRDRVLEGIRARSKSSLMRRELIARGRRQFTGRKVLFVLPITEPGGGANVILDEAVAMREMGVDACVFNRAVYRPSFEQAYPSLQVPAVYGSPEDLRIIAAEYDAVIASVYFTVEWLRPLAESGCPSVLAYYVQGFEPYIYEQGTTRYCQALESYTAIPSLKLFTKTEWTQNEVYEHTKVSPSLVGASVNTDLFRPRPRREGSWPERPLRVAAMIRPSTPYREPELTMRVLRRTYREYPGRVQSMLFGSELDDAAFGRLPHDFPWWLAGVLNRRQVARFFNEVDIFVDLSSHQAMGLTALEAMACGVAVVVPEQGGTASFARHERNSLVVDTTSAQSSFEALGRLIEDRVLRRQLQRAALKDVTMLFPERCAVNILRVLFGKPW